VYYVNKGYASTTSPSNILITLSTDTHHLRLYQNKIVQYVVPFLDYHIILYNDGLLYNEVGVKYQPAPVFTNYNETILKIDYCLGDCLWVLTNYHYVYQWDFKTNVLSLVSDQHEIVSIYGDRFESSVYMISSEQKLFVGDTSGLLSMFSPWQFIDVIRNEGTTILRRRDGEIYINGITIVMKAQKRFKNYSGPIAMTASEIWMTEKTVSGIYKCLVKYDMTFSEINTEVQLYNRIEYPVFENIGNIMVVKDLSANDVVVFTSTNSNPIRSCSINQTRDASLSCVPCEIDEYNTDGVDCIPCEVGFERAIGSDVCVRCDTKSKSTAGSGCETCPENMEQDIDDPSQCTNCPADWERLVGSLECTPCVLPARSVSGSPCGLQRCSRDNYLDTDGVCRGCPQCHSSLEGSVGMDSCNYFGDDFMSEYGKPDGCLWSSERGTSTTTPATTTPATTTPATIPPPEIEGCCSRSDDCYFGQPSCLYS
jgi:hypothetical protein